MLRRRQLKHLLKIQPCGWRMCPVGGCVRVVVAVGRGLKDFAGDDDLQRR